MKKLSGHSSHMAASFTDLMASLMVIFVLLFVNNANNEALSRQTVKENLLKVLRHKLESISGLDAGAIREDDRDPFAIIVVMPDSLLFARGKWNIREPGKIWLNRFVPDVARILSDFDGKEKRIESVVVEGHTDTTYVGGRYASLPSDVSPIAGQSFNLDLSQKRSMEVVKASLDALRESSTWPWFLSMISASGRGQEELLAGVSGDDERQRRVVFKIRIQADAAGELARDVTATGARIRGDL